MYICIVRFKKYCTNFDAQRRILHVRADEALAPSSLVPQIIRSCAKTSALVRECPYDMHFCIDRYNIDIERYRYRYSKVILNF
jgi:hypothetical protein